MSDIDARLSRMLEQRSAEANPKEFLLDLADMVARDAGESFGRQVDEIGIMLAGTHAPYLRFVTPRKLCDLGTVPLTKRDSIAVTVFSRKAADVSNNVPAVRHVSFFESVKLKDTSHPIMKMVTVPLVFEGRAVGVAQVSKKGPSPSEAGPDFTAAEVQKIADYFAEKTVFLVEARPQSF